MAFGKWRSGERCVANCLNVTVTPAGGTGVGFVIVEEAW